MSRDDRPEGLAAWTDLCNIVDSVRLALNRELQQQVGVTLAENLVLCHVAMAPGQRLRMIDIAQLLMIGKSAVTKTVDRLEERGLLARSRDSADRRTIYAVLTPQGTKVFGQTQPVYIGAVGRYFSDLLTEGELAGLRRASDRIKSERPGGPGAGARPAFLRA
jgi:DNA-binding MarR family transcriptional regulator